MFGQFRPSDTRSEITAVIGALLIVLAPAPTLLAQDGGDPALEEVFQSELAYPQERGELQITVAPRVGRRGDEASRGLPLVLEYGVTDAWAVEAEWHLLQELDESGETTAGVGDLEIGARWSRLDLGGSGLHLAAGLEIALPIGAVDRELSEGLLEVEPFVAIQKDLPRLGLFAHLGLSFVDRVRSAAEVEEDEVEPEAHEAFVNAGFFVPVGRVVLTQELNWSNNRWNRGGDENELFWTPGVVVDLPGNQEVGFGFPVGLTGDADDVRVIAMWTWEVELFSDDD